VDLLSPIKSKRKTEANLTSTLLFIFFIFFIFYSSLHFASDVLEHPSHQKMSTHRLSRIETKAAKQSVEQREYAQDGKPAAVQMEDMGNLSEDPSEDFIDPRIEKNVVRKLDRRVVPWLFGMFLLCFLDRANIGNAKIEGLGEDLHLTSNQFNIALAVFFIPYILVEVRYLP
jgi:hypothetical protein